MKSLIVALVFLMIGITVPVAAEEVYQWVDENGVRRFADRPPDTAAQEVNRTQAIPYDRAADQQRTRADDASNQQWVEAEKARQARAEAEARKAMERKQAEQERIEDQKREEEAQRKAQQEERRKNKSAAKKARTRPPTASPR